MLDNTKEYLSFDDVSLLPRYSDILPSQVNLETQLTNSIKLNIPLLSAAMDTVTESSMATTMARNGGLGIIHKNLTIEQQVTEVRKVKRAQSVIIPDPISVSPKHTLHDVLRIMKENNISGVPVVNQANVPVGILTARDIRFAEDLNASVSSLMTTDLITVSKDVTIDQAKELLHKHRIEKLIVLSDNKLFGLITVKDLLQEDKSPLAVKDENGRLLVGAAIGVGQEHLDRAKGLIEAGADVICVDSAHGHSKGVLSTVEKLCNTYNNLNIIAGNVVTKDATLALINAGVDSVKTGQGGGCFAAGTRILMSNGFYKNIEDISPGDRIINKNGDPVNVKKSFCTGVKNVQKIRSSIFYNPTWVTGDHKYFIGDLNTVSQATIKSMGYVALLKKKTKSKASKFKWKQINDLNQDVLLLPRKINFELNNTFTIILMRRCSGDGRTNTEYKEDVVLTPTYELGYIFGTFLGDGHAHIATIKKGTSKVGSVRWFFGKNEQNIANKLTSYIYKLFNRSCSTSYERNMIVIRFYHKPLAEFLAVFGKKHLKHLPTEYLVNNDLYLKGIFDGLIDSDGYIEPYGRIRFTNTSKHLIELFNIICYITNGFFPNNSQRSISVGCLKGAHIENYHQPFMTEVNTTAKKRLTEKYQVAKLLEHNQTENVKKVYDLEIDCPTHSFIANNSIVHNSICSTRIVAGVGVPQLSAILECVEIAKKHNISIIADGGIRYSGDIVKALAAGASSVMIGSLFAGTDEAPGETVLYQGRAYKTYRGMGSIAAMQQGSKDRYGQQDIVNDKLVPEGVEGCVPYKGSVSSVIYQLVGGVKSGLGYLGAKSISNLNGVEFIKITAQGLRESHAHDIFLMKESPNYRVDNE